MKSKITLGILLLGVIFSIQMNAQIVTIKFVTLGNCLTCKDRIEGAVNELTGISSVHYDAINEETMIAFDKSLMDSYTIMHKIADVGHDNEWYRAPDSAYNLLIGTCCEYQRRLDYSNVQIGYFSLMGIWENVLSISTSEKVKTTLSQGSEIGVYNINIESEGNSINKNIEVYSISGAKVYFQEAQIGNNPIDIKFLPSGLYIIIITENKIPIFKSKIIKP